MLLLNLRFARLLSLAGGCGFAIPSSLDTAGAATGGAGDGVLCFVDSSDTAVSRGVSCKPLEPWPFELADEVVTETTDVSVSGCAIGNGFAGESAPEAVLVFVPASEPLVELGPDAGPPTALAEFIEYIEDTDRRLFSPSEIEGLDFASGTSDILASSAMVELNRGVLSKSSTAISSLLALRLALNPCLKISAALGVRELYVEEVRDFVFGLVVGGGM